MCIVRWTGHQRLKWFVLLYPPPAHENWVKHKHKPIRTTYYSTSRLITVHNLCTIIARLCLIVRSCPPYHWTLYCETKAICYNVHIVLVHYSTIRMEMSICLILSHKEVLRGWLTRQNNCLQRYYSVKVTQYTSTRCLHCHVIIISSFLYDEWNEVFNKFNSPIIRLRLIYL